MQPRKLLIATLNRGKVREINELLTGLAIEVESLEAYPTIPEVEETGKTFEANACLKAIEYSRRSGLLALADDSGLEIEALDGRPGVLSARYGGDHLGFDLKMEKLLVELKGSGSSNRRARFVCSMAVAEKGKILFTAQGICSGSIADSARGSAGFGYDPLFVPEGCDLTFGELRGAIKSRISHRARALEQIIPFLRHFIAL